MTTPKRALAALLTAATIGAGLAVIPATAALAAAPSSCANSSVCGYVNTGYRTDQGYEWIPVQRGGTCVIVSHRNAWSGMFNNSGRTVRMFRNTGCTGTDYKTFTNGWGHHQFSIRFGPTWDNSVDAILFI